MTVAYCYNDQILDSIMEMGKIGNLVFNKPMETFFVVVKVLLLMGIIDGIFLYPLPGLEVRRGGARVHGGDAPRGEVPPVAVGTQVTQPPRTDQYVKHSRIRLLLLQ